MADVMFKDPYRVIVRLRIDRSVFDALEAAYGSQNLALRAMRQELPECLMWLVRQALADPERVSERRTVDSSKFLWQSGHSIVCRKPRGGPLRAVPRYTLCALSFVSPVLSGKPCSPPSSQYIPSCREHD